MNTIAINIAPTVRIAALADAVRQIGHELVSKNGRITVQPGRPRLARGGTRLQRKRR